MTINPLLVEQAIKDVAEDDDLYFHGIYRGRNFFEGIAISFADANAMRKFNEALHMNGEDVLPLILGHDHEDNMAGDILIAWNKSRFDWDIAEANDERWQEDWQ